MAIAFDPEILNMIYNTETTIMDAIIKPSRIHR